MAPASSGISRRLALETLCAWQDSGRPVRPFLDRFCDRFGPGERDRRLALTLVQGVLRNMQGLDRVVDRQSSTPVQRLAPRVRMALRLGVFQLLCLDRVPESAAVNETVTAFKRGRRPGWQVGFVNGVLRGVARNRERLAPELAEAANHPDWMVRRWQERFGPSIARAICAAANRPSPLTLRINSRRCRRSVLLAEFSRQGIAARACRYSGDGVVLDGFSGSPAGLPGFAEGWFQVQGEAAQLVSGMLPLRMGGRYLDACAGLGGKTGHLAQRLPAGGRLLAVEPDPGRFSLLEENLVRLGLADLVQCHCLALEDLDKGGPFDGILLDVPCSGTGITGRQPDIRWNRKPGEIDVCRRIQEDLLERAVSLLTEDGLLLYATCSLEKEENQDVVEAFLARHPDFSVVNARTLLPVEAGELVTEEGFFSPIPAQGLDGFFGACLRRC